MAFDTCPALTLMTATSPQIMKINDSACWRISTCAGRFKYRGTGCGGAAQLHRCPIRCT